MTIHFAAARGSNGNSSNGDRALSPVARALSRRPILRVANDNGQLSNGLGCNNPLMQAALRHFAQHGLSAASEAAKCAEDAFTAGDREAYDWWIGVCRTLDKRMAAEIQRKNAVG
ncbi:hypothetical protein [Pontixanthobacter sp.]|uniref:hypothetical protein n=1 Tax=Pontixanthobacter sp. TaxID=2792078 RepID=UPI003C7C94CF